MHRCAFETTDAKNKYKTARYSQTLSCRRGRWFRSARSHHNPPWGIAYERRACGVVPPARGSLLQARCAFRKPVSTVTRFARDHETGSAFPGLRPRVPQAAPDRPVWRRSPASSCAFGMRPCEMPPEAAGGTTFHVGKRAGPAMSRPGYCFMNQNRIPFFPFLTERGEQVRGALPLP